MGRRTGTINIPLKGFTRTVEAEIQGSPHYFPRACWMGRYHGLVPEDA